MVKTLDDLGNRFQNMVGGLAGNRPPLQLKSAPTGHDVFGCATLDGADVDGRGTGIEETVRFLGKLRSKFFDGGDEPGSVVDRRDSLLRVGAVGFFAVDRDLSQTIAFACAGGTQFAVKSSEKPLNVGVAFGSCVLMKTS